MHLSKAQITRLIIIALIVVSGWTIWKRLDAVIDNYKQYYDTALGVKIIQDMWGHMSNDFDRKFDNDWDKFNRDFDRRWGKDKDNLYAENEPDSLNESRDEGSHQEQETERKWQEYKKNAPIKPHNKPVPMIADEWAKGYYSGFWNFLITSGLASVFAVIIVVVSGGFLIKYVFKKLTDEKIENVLKKVGLE